MKKMFSLIVVSMMFSLYSFAQSSKPIPQQAKTKTTTKKDAAVSKEASDSESAEKDLSSNENLKKLIANQQIALQHLEFLRAEAGYVDNEERRVILLVKIADALWQFDSVRAKQQFKDAFAMIDSIENPNRKNGGMISRQPVNENTAKPKDTLRQEVIRVISNRDVELADILAQSIASPGASKGQTDKRVIDLRLNLAMAIAESEPEKAAAILNDTLSDGIQGKTIGVLLRVRQKKSELADTLFTKIVAIADGNPAYYSYQILQMLGLYISDHTHQALQPKQLNHVVATQLLRFAYKVISYQLESQLAGTAISETGQGVAASYLVLQQLSPLFERFLPEEAVAVKTRLKELSLLVPHQLKDSLITANSKDQDSVKDLLAQASVTQDFNKKDSLLMRAAILAARQGNIDEGLAIADRQSNIEERKFTASLIGSQAVAEAMSSKNLEKAYKYAREISDLQNRSESFIKMTNLVLANKDSQRARGILVEIALDIDRSDEPSSEKAWCLLKITEAAVRVDFELAAQLVVSAIGNANSADWEKPSTKKVSRYKATITLDRFQFDSVFTPLAQNNFERALGMATTIEKKDLSILAQLSACRAYLEKPYEKALKSDSR